MKKIALAAAAAMTLSTVTFVGSHAAPYDGSTITVNGHEWTFSYSGFGIQEAENDGYDRSKLQLSLDGGTTFTDINCEDVDANSNVDATPMDNGAMAIRCQDPSLQFDGLSVDMYGYLYPSGLLAAVTYEITNVSGSSINYVAQFKHNYGEGNINGADHTSVYSLGNGTEFDTTPAATAWGDSGSGGFSCLVESSGNDGYDDMELETGLCGISAGATVSYTTYHLINGASNSATLNSDALSLFVERTADATLAEGIPVGIMPANWSIGGTTTFPEFSDAPYEMSLTGDAVMGEYLTVSFAEGVTPVGDYFDIWMCPNTDVRPVDGGEMGECQPVTFWNRAAVANYNQATSALTMTWQLSNDSVPGYVSEGGVSYLDGTNEPILVDPPETEGGWCQYEGWHIIVNDYSGGGHSNFSDPLSAVGCSIDPEEETPEGETSELADTGFDVQSGLTLVAAALFAGLAALVAARRRAARSL